MQLLAVLRRAGSRGGVLLRAFAAASLPEHKALGMPKVSPTMTHGRLIEWKKAEGEAIAEGDIIAEVETDKATMPIEAKDEGFMARILVDADTPDIPLGQIIAIMVEEEGDLAAFKDYVPPTATTPAGDGATTAAPDAPKQAPTPTTAAAPISKSPAVLDEDKSAAGIIGPAVGRLLAEFPDADLARINGTGPKGRVLKGDVLAAITDGSAFGAVRSSAETGQGATPGEEPVSASAEYTDVKVSSMRKAIARRLTESKQTTPHQYATATYELDALLALRKRLNAADPSPAISVNDFVLKATATALRRVPEMNAQWDSSSMSAVPNQSVDVAFAVALEGGLITPIVKNADSRGLGGIAAETKRLVSLAREGKLQPDEYEGGSFSTSNLGMYGVSSFSAIINPPQSGNLAIASGIPRCVAGDSETEVRVATIGTARVSTDARIVDDAAAARFVREFASCMSNPENMLL